MSKTRQIVPGQIHLYYQHWLKLLQKKSVFNLAEFPLLKLPSYVNSFMYLFGGKILTEDASWAKLHYYITYLFCSTICIAYLPTLFWKYSSLYLEISNIVLDTISLPHKTYTHPSRQLHSCLDRKKTIKWKYIITHYDSIRKDIILMDRQWY